MKQSKFVLLTLHRSKLKKSGDKLPEHTLFSHNYSNFPIFPKKNHEFWNHEIRGFFEACNEAIEVCAANTSWIKVGKKW